jgi:nucleotide sugar dehydrogenase
LTSVAVIGLGYVGQVNALYLTKEGRRVHGVDHSDEVVGSLRRGETRLAEEGAADSLRDALGSGRLTIHTLEELSDLKPNVFIVCVPTPCAPREAPDLSAVDGVGERIGEVAQPEQLILLRSTVPPGTTRGRFLQAIRRRADVSHEGLHVAYCPERMAEGVPLTAEGLDEIFRRAPLLVGGVDPGSTEAACSFWESTGVPTRSMSSCDAAELSKLLCNEWIDVSIALANETALLCQRLGLDALEVISAANTLPKGASTVNVMRPGAGVGGSCLTKDPWLMAHVAEEHGIRLSLPAAARGVNDGMPDHVLALADDEMRSADRDWSEADVAVLGVAFKERTADIRETPAEAIVRGLIERGAKVRLHDPWVITKRKTFLDLPILEEADDALRGADCLLLVTSHPEFAALELEHVAELLAPPGIVIDGRRIWSPKQIRTLGLRYRAVGLGTD